MAADNIADRQQESAAFFGLFHGGQCVGRFTGLADADDHVAGANQRLAVAKLGCIIDLHGNARQTFDQKLSDKSRMQ